MATRIIVTGDRNLYVPLLAIETVDRFVVRYGDVIVIHGACEGVDKAFADACEFLGVPDEPHPADWNAYGKAAGPLRNSAMVKLGAAFGVAVHENLSASKGTLDCVRKMLKAGIPVYLIRGEDCEPERVAEVRAGTVIMAQKARSQ